MSHKPLKCADDIKQRPFTPQAHQLRVAREFLETNKRGLLFWHQLGSGKTCACYLAVDGYRRAKEPKKVFILAPAALASTHREQYCELCGSNPRDYFRDFMFFSYNDRAGIAKKMSQVNMDDSIIVIDEVQDVINGKHNRSASLSAVYDKVLRASRAKVILLSATPFYDEHGAALLINLLDPGSVPMDALEFKRAIANKDYLFEKLRGLVSYVPVPNPELYPSRVVPDIVDRIPMSRYQFLQYRMTRDDELNATKIQEEQIQAAIRKGDRKKVEKLKALQYIQSAKLKSRQICNFAYPVEQIKGEVDLEFMGRNLPQLIEGEEVDLDNLPVDEEGINQQYSSDDYEADWILNDASDKHVRLLKEYSPKMAKLIHRILTLPGKHMVYGWFKSKYGLNLIYTYLKHCGIDALIFSGDLGSDEKRAAVIKAHNALENARGENYKAILVSGAGAMGISLYGVQHAHIFEASLNEFITLQAEGRVFRTYSHHQLPPEERHVQVYRYFTVLPDNVNYGETETTEEMVYRMGMKKVEAVSQILEIMKRASFDCREPYNAAIRNCYVYDTQIAPSNDYDFEVSPYETSPEEKKELLPEEKVEETTLVPSQVEEVKLYKFCQVYSNPKYRAFWNKVIGDNLFRIGQTGVQAGLDDDTIFSQMALAETNKQENASFSSFKTKYFTELGLAIDKKTSILDYGGASGMLARALADQFQLPAVQVADLHPPSFVVQDPRVRYTQIEAGQNLPFPENSVDIISSLMVLHHVENPLFVIRELHRVGKRWLLIQEHDATPEFSDLLDLLHGMYSFVWKDADYQQISRFSEYRAWYRTAEEWNRLLKGRFVLRKIIRKKPEIASYIALYEKVGNSPEFVTVDQVEVAQGESRRGQPGNYRGRGRENYRGRGRT